MTDYRATLNLPRTAFPMKADLATREPQRVAWWDEQRTYERRLERNASNGPWVLHDGPPYANGELHMGHFLGMVLKDTFVKVALLDGKYAKFVPGWDMHGLPIEYETLKHLGIKDFHSIDPLELREQCKERALYWLDRQREQRRRMGNFGLWDRPYRTIDPSFEATIVNALAELAARQQIYKGLRSTLWCVHDETALAEAEIEYEPRVSLSIYVRFCANGDQREQILKVFGVEAPAGERISFLIWTTTPWTLPANVAIALRPDATYGLYRVDGEMVIAAEALAQRAFGERFAGATLAGRARGEQLDGLAVRHPFMDRDSVVVLADYVDLETGTGAVHTAPGHGADDFDTAMKYDLPILNPVDAAGHFTPEAGPYAGLQIFAANDQIVRRPARERRVVERGGIRALVSALLALPQPGHLPRNRAVVSRYGSESVARARDRRDRRGRVRARVGTRTSTPDDRDPSGVVPLPPAHLGNSDSGADLQSVQRVGSRPARRPKGGRAIR